MAVGRPQVLTGSRIETSISCHLGLPTGPPTTRQLELPSQGTLGKNEWAIANKAEVSHFTPSSGKWHPVTLPYSLWSKSLGPTLHSRERDYRGQEYQEARITGNHLETTGYTPFEPLESATPEARSFLIFSVMRANITFLCRSTFELGFCHVMCNPWSPSLIH